MKKNTLLLLFFCFFVSLNAQVEHSSKAITMTIGLENNLQLFSKSVARGQFVQSSPSPFFNSKFIDGYAKDLVVAIGSKKILENDNYQAWSIFGSGSSWDRNDVFNVEDSQGNILDQTRFFAGKVKAYSLGLRYTYGLSLTHKPNLNFLIGFRGELHGRYYSAPATEGIGFDTRANDFSIRTFAVPEMQYIIPDTRYIMSLRVGLPVASIGGNSQTVENPVLSARQQKNGGFFLDSFDFKGYLFELSFGFFLKP